MFFGTQDATWAAGCPLLSSQRSTSPSQATSSQRAARSHRPSEEVTSSLAPWSSWNPLFCIVAAANRDPNLAYFYSCFYFYCCLYVWPTSTPTSTSTSGATAPCIRPEPPTLPGFAPYQRIRNPKVGRLPGGSLRL
mmetsp:Transcript_53191/g.113647  ORF Transcript_53191/g.113647 Transcript_53191/m.113647 type:complete len:136 (-) Transcript_53191:16-423(-)